MKLCDRCAFGDTGGIYCDEGYNKDFMSSAGSCLKMSEVQTMRSEKEIREELKQLEIEKNGLEVLSNEWRTANGRYWALRWVLKEELD